MSPLYFYEHILVRLGKNPNLTAKDISAEFDIPEHAAQMGLDYAKKVGPVKQGGCNARR